MSSVSQFFSCGLSLDKPAIQNLAITNGTIMLTWLFIVNGNERKVQAGSSEAYF